MPTTRHSDPPLPQPAARHSHPPTSHEAAARQSSLRVKHAAMAVIYALQAGPATDQAIEARVRASLVAHPHITASSLRSRRSELVRLGAVVPHSVGRSRSGYRSQAWALAPQWRTLCPWWAR